MARSDARHRHEGLATILVLDGVQSGIPLNRQLIELGGKFDRAVQTALIFRLYALADTVPPKPGKARSV